MLCYTVAYCGVWWYTVHLIQKHFYLTQAPSSLPQVCVCVCVCVCGFLEQGGIQACKGGGREGGREEVLVLFSVSPPLPPALPLLALNSSSSSIKPSFHSFFTNLPPPACPHSQELGRKGRKCLPPAPPLLPPRLLFDPGDTGSLSLPPGSSGSGSFPPEASAPPLSADKIAARWVLSVGSPPDFA